MTEKSEKINCFYLLLCLLAFYETRSSLANVLTSPKYPSHQRIISNNSQYQPHVWKKYEIVNMSLNEESLFRWSKQNCFSPKHELRYESSTLILYKELSSSIFCCEWVSQALVTPVQISTFCNIERHECPLLTQYHQFNCYRLIVSYTDPVHSFIIS